MEFFLDTIDVWFFLALLMVGYAAGRRAESKHYASIHSREKSLALIPVVTSRTLDDPREVLDRSLATGSVVVAIDYYKRFLMGLRTLIGGEAKGYSSLIDRARREALLRMRASAADADVFLNLRIQTATLQGGRGNAASSVEIIAYATAVRYADS